MVSMEEKKQQILNSFAAKISLVGIKNGLVKKALNIRDNLKSNPRNLMLVEGLWAIQKAIENHLEIEEFFFCAELVFSAESIAILEKILFTEKKGYQISEKTAKILSEKENPDGLLGIVSLPSFSLQNLQMKKNCCFCILDGVEIPGNIGTIIRSIDGAGGNGVIVTNRRARITHPKVLKASLGSVFHVPVVEEAVENVGKWLKEQGIALFLLDSDSTTSLYHYPFPDRIAIVAGSERYGIHPAWYDFPHTAISIPMKGSCDSLNVAIATSLALYEINIRQKGL